MITKYELEQFTGTEQYYKHWTKLMVYTDGVSYLADKGECHWLLDVIASYQIKSEIRKTKFQVWEFKKDINGGGVVTMKEDKGKPEIVNQKIPHTDFPLNEISLWLIDGVLILPSEY